MENNYDETYKLFILWTDFKNLFFLLKRAILPLE